MAMVSPLHRVIDAGRWDAERLLGRLIIVVHAAFLDAGFVPLPHRSRKPGSVPRQAGRTASSLSLRYGAPQLLQRRRPLEEEVAVLRILAYGRHLVLYVQRDPWPAVERCVLVDALAAAPLLSGGLDSTGRGLRSDATLAGLWRWLSDGLCRRVLVDMCRRNGGVEVELELEPTFMSLPGDAKAAILARLTDGADLARVECVCTGLRRLVAERDGELWKARYDALMCDHVSQSSSLPDDYSGIGGHSSSSPPPETSWKERYVRARRCQPPAPAASLVARYVQYNFQDRVFEVMVRIDPSTGMTTRRELAGDPVADRRNNRIAAMTPSGKCAAWRP